MYQEITRARTTLTPELKTRLVLQASKESSLSSELSKMYKDPQKREIAESVIIMKGIASCVQKILSNQDICPKKKS